MFDNLSTELILYTLHFLPLCVIRSKTKLLSRRWLSCSVDVLRKRLQKYSTALNKPHAWILSNFEKNDRHNVVTAMSLKLSGVNFESGLLQYIPTGEASFGMWIEYVGYIPITRPHAWESFHFHPTMVVKFHFWFDSSGQTDETSPFARSKVILSTLPTGTRSVQGDIGMHRMQLHDEFGHAGWLTYNIDRVGFTYSQSDSLSDSLILGEIDAMQTGEMQIFGQLVSVEVDPQILFAQPV